MVSRRIVITHYAEKSPKLKLGANTMDLLSLGANRLIALANTMVIALMVIIFVKRRLAILYGIANICLIGI